jgi:hypothetical protein
MDEGISPDILKATFKVNPSSFSPILYIFFHLS